MAIAGGACSAYKCQVVDGELYVTSTTMLRSLCTDINDALDKLAAGEVVTVAGSEMAGLRGRIRQVGVKC